MEENGPKACLAARLTHHGMTAAIRWSNGDISMNIPEINSVDTSELLKNIQSILEEKSIRIPDKPESDATNPTPSSQPFPLIEDKSDNLPALGRYVNIWA